MRTVYKYQITDADLSIELPRGAQPLSVQFQGHGEMNLWAIVDPEQPTETRRFVVAGTGHELPEGGLNHISTIQQLGGDLIWHIFEVL